MTAEIEEACPGCGESLVGGKIPYDIVQHYIPLEWYDNKDAWLAQNPWPTWKTKIGKEIQGVYDGVLIWHHEACGHHWPRFTEGRLRIIAEGLIKKWESHGN